MKLHSIPGMGDLIERKAPTLEGASGVVALDYVLPADGTLENLRRRLRLERLERLERLSGALAILVCVYLAKGAVS